MRRIEVNLCFTLDVKTDKRGVPEELVDLSWLDVVCFGLTDGHWKKLKIDSVHRGRRRLRDLGDPCNPDKPLKRRAIARHEERPTPKRSKGAG